MLHKLKLAQSHFTCSCVNCATHQILFDNDIGCMNLCRSAGPKFFCLNWILNLGCDIENYFVKLLACILFGLLFIINNINSWPDRQFNRFYKAVFNVIIIVIKTIVVIIIVTFPNTCSDSFVFLWRHTNLFLKNKLLKHHLSKNVPESKWL